MTAKIETKLWLIGVLMLVALIASGQLFMGDSAFTILDHQAAATAERVDEIQAAWQAEGYFTQHAIGMVGDLIFICVYSLGTWRAGKALRDSANGFARIVGAITLGLAVIFFVTDITETSLQLVQMLTGEGVNWMAGTAAFMQPIKINAWIASFLAVIIGLVANRFSSSAH